jgi:hypothetical protein
LLDIFDKQKLHWSAINKMDRMHYREALLNLKKRGEMTVCGAFNWSLCLLLLLLFVPAMAQSNPHGLDISISRTGARFDVQVQFTAPVNPCQAYVFLTNYEEAKSIPGILSSKVLGRESNKVLVERVAKERILLIPVYLHSTLEFTEVSTTQINFTQIKGDAKSYSGNWIVSPDKRGTRFTHHATFELDASIPLFIVQYFLENSAAKRFETMAENVGQIQVAANSHCRMNP